METTDPQDAIMCEVCVSVGVSPGLLLDLRQETPPPPLRVEPQLYWAAPSNKAAQLLVLTRNLSPVLQEIFGPVLTVYVYPEKDYREVLELIDRTSPYALTGSVFAQDQ